MSKKINTGTILLFCALILISYSSFSQKKELKYEVGTSAQLSSKSTLSFWLVSNKNEMIPKQHSSYLEVNVPVRNIPFKIDLARAFDRGELLGDNVGFMLRLSNSGIISSSNYSKSKKSNQ